MDKKKHPSDRVLTGSEEKLWEKVVGDSRLKFLICISLLYVLQIDSSIRVYRLNASEWKPQALQMHQDKQNFEWIPLKYILVFGPGGEDNDVLRYPFCSRELVNCLPAPESVLSFLLQDLDFKHPKEHFQVLWRCTRTAVKECKILVSSSVKFWTSNTFKENQMYQKATAGAWGTAGHGGAIALTHCIILADFFKTLSSSGNLALTSFKSLEVYHYSGTICTKYNWKTARTLSEVCRCYVEKRIRKHMLLFDS